jgi:hypothetical protein
MRRGFIPGEAANADEAGDPKQKHHQRCLIPALLD